MAKLPKNEWCQACKWKEKADKCVRRRQSSNAPDLRSLEKEKKRLSIERDFYGNFASAQDLEDLDRRIEEDISLIYPWCPSWTQGGTRKSPRLQWQQIQKTNFETTREKMQRHPLHQLIKRRKVTRAATVPDATQNQPTQTPPPVVPEQQSIDSILSRASKRRLIQIAFELLGSPEEFDDQGINQWQGQGGVVNLIRDYIGLTSHRARSQILDVMHYVTQCNGQGQDACDAGKKINACKSGRRCTLEDKDHRRVANLLREGFGTQMTRAIINKTREQETGASPVSKSTIRRSAKNAFGGECRNRGKKKTGSKDPKSVWCMARHELSLQLQQQFREGDVPGPKMIGVTVCKFFGDKLFKGKVTAFDRAHKWYKVKYDDGDEEELSFRQLRVPEWKPIPRAGVLWVDEKVTCVFESRSWLLYTHLIFPWQAIPAMQNFTCHGSTRCATCLTLSSGHLQ